MIGIIGTLGSAIVSGIQGYVQRKQELAQAKHQAKVKRIAEGDAHAARLDEISISQRGWKDEYLLIITTMPVLLLFGAPLAEVGSPAQLTGAVTSGFEALQETPEYYWYALALIYVDTFGFRRMFRVAVEGWLRKKFGGSS